jgi:hypothetical protein
VDAGRAAVLVLDAWRERGELQLLHPPALQAELPPKHPPGPAS